MIMTKKLFAIFLLCCFMVSAVPMQALASQEQYNEALLKKLLIIMQHDLQASDKVDELSSASLRTQMLLDELLTVLKNKDNKQLKTIVEDYAADMAVLQDDTQINPQCLLTLWGVFDTISSLVSTVITISGGGNTTCLIVNITGNVGSIISAFQSYRLCQILNSATPDQALCKQIVQNQNLIKISNYIANVLNVFICSGTPAASDYLNLVRGLLELFLNEGDPCETQTPAT
jgi:hypothetical protein